MADEDFEEGEVLWALVKERNDHESFCCRGKKGHSFFSSSTSSSSTASKLIPRSINGSHEDNSGSKNNRQSAPVHIPDWSKIYRSTSNADHHHHHGESVEVDDDDDDDESCEKVPPHEWIAKKLARSQISSFSVCEGAGRTLKGRDQRKVRNAVLTRTGFLE